VRRPFTTQQAYDRGISRHALQWAVRTGRIQRLVHGVYIKGGEPPTPLERALAIVVATDGVASGTLAGMLYKLDSVTLEPPFATVPPSKETRHRVRHADVVSVSVQGVPCTDGLQALIDLARQLDDLRLEHAMESALHKKLVTIEMLDTARSKRIQRVLALRPVNAPPTESLLETLMVQLIRTEPRLPTPERQVVVLNKWEGFVARVDLAWPEYGIFLELDGQHHLGQPLYDASRQTAVVAAKGWLPGRFTWHEVTCSRKPTCRRLMELFEQASQLRPRDNWQLVLTDDSCESL
jgi:very-short-patch-repair endonuclease